jgi:N-acetylglucosamine-6-phosphate deacetylase
MSVAMDDRFALIGAKILAGRDWLDGHAVVVEAGAIAEICPASELESGLTQVVLDGGALVAGFVDLQVNGGGNALLNDQPSLDTVRTMAAAHRRFGTTALLPTLISEDMAVIAAAIAAVRTAIAEGVPGVVGIHIEGPFLNPLKAGIHDTTKFRKLDARAIDQLCSLDNGRTLITLAPELCDPADLAELTRRGVTVCAGHSLATYEEAVAAFAAGVRGTTHLFNAMSQFGSREPGLVGAALLTPSVISSLIADGRHVHPAAMRLAWQMLGNDGITLVTDAMSTVGGTIQSFEFNGVEISVDGYSCVAPDGTLAGSNLDMASAVRNAVDMLGVSPADACTMASHTPARLIGLDDRLGRIAPGLRADFVHLDDQLQVTATWIGGLCEAVVR